VPEAPETVDLDYLLLLLSMFLYYISNRLVLAVVLKGRDEAIRSVEAAR
jgi:hypothetical protein